MRQIPICLRGWCLSGISNPGFVSCSTYKVDTDIRGRNFFLPHSFSCDLLFYLYVGIDFAKVRLSILQVLFLIYSFVWSPFFCIFENSGHFRTARSGVYICECSIVYVMI